MIYEDKTQYPFLSPVDFKGIVEASGLTLDLFAESLGIPREECAALMANTNDKPSRSILARLILLPAFKAYCEKDKAGHYKGGKYRPAHIEGYEEVVQAVFSAIQYATVEERYWFYSRLAERAERNKQTLFRHLTCGNYGA